MPFPCAGFYFGVEGVAVDPEEGPSDSGTQKLTSPAHGSLDLLNAIRQYVVIRHVVSEGIMASAPISEPILLILLSLADQPRHGYAILRDTETMTEGRLRLSTGTLYGALHRLLADGWIERFHQEDGSRGKQVYRLTTLGRRNLQQEITRLRLITRLASLRVASKET